MRNLWLSPILQYLDLNQLIDSHLYIPYSESFHFLVNQYPHYAKQMYTISADPLTYIDTQQVLDSITRLGNLKNKWRKQE